MDSFLRRRSRSRCSRRHPSRFGKLSEAKRLLGIERKPREHNPTRGFLSLGPSRPCPPPSLVGVVPPLSLSCAPAKKARLPAYWLDLDEGGREARSSLAVGTCARDGQGNGGGPHTAVAGREEAQGDGEEGAADRDRDPAPLRHRQGDLPLPAQPPRAGGPHQRLR
jgi:hypothetical protein